MHFQSKLGIFRKFKSLSHRTELSYSSISGNISIFSLGSHWIIIVLTMIGKLCGSGAYACIILFTPELYPTTVRSTATSMSNMSSRLGAVLAPYVVDLVS